MVLQKRIKKAYSCNSFTKGIGFILLILLSSCSSKNKSEKSPATIEKITFHKQEGEINQLTTQGENTSPSFSAQTNEVAFVKKLTTENSEVFLKNLVDKKEKRITFNLGENRTPHFHPTRNWIAYSGSADEKLEDHYIKCLVNKNYKDIVQLQSKTDCSEEPFEVYIAQNNGSDIRRITKQKGLDKLPTFSKKGQEIFYVHSLGKIEQIFSFNLQNNSQRLSYTTTSLVSDLSASEKFIAHIEGEKGNRNLKIFNLKKWNPYFSLEGKDVSHVELHPTEEFALISGKINDSSDQNIFLLDLKNKCFIQQTHYKSEDLEPAFGPGLKTYFFSSNRGGEFQIYSAVLKVDETCKPL